MKQNAVLYHKMLLTKSALYLRRFLNVANSKKGTKVFDVKYVLFQCSYELFLQKARNVTKHSFVSQNAAYKVCFVHEQKVKCFRQATEVPMLLM